MKITITVESDNGRITGMFDTHPDLEIDHGPVPIRPPLTRHGVVAYPAPPSIKTLIDQTAERLLDEMMLDGQVSWP